MRTRSLPLLGLLLALPIAAQAAEPSVLQVTETVLIDAKPQLVWDLLKDFNGMPKWHPRIVRSEIVSGEDDTPGTVRLLTLKDGGTLEETLSDVSDDEMEYAYAIDKGTLPVSNYSSSISIEPGEDDTSIIEWQGNFMRKSPEDDPPAGEDDDAAIKAVTDFYQAGLAHLKSMLEHRQP